MAKELGDKRRAYVIASTGNSYTVLAGEQTNSVNRSAELMDTADKDAGEWQTNISGKKSIAVDITVGADTSNAPQLEALNAFLAGDEIKVFIGTLKDGAPFDGDACTYLISSVSDTNDKGSYATRAFSLASNGVPTVYAQGNQIYPAV